MAFRVQDYTANVKELARQYQFELEVVFPQIIGRQDLVNLLVHSTKMPGRNIAPTANTAFMGMNYKLAANISYDDWSANFRVDENYDLVKIWRAWIELIHGTQTNISTPPSVYKSNIILHRLDGAGNRLMKITLFGAWPSNISLSNLDTSTREVQDAAVTIKYDYNLTEVAS